MPVIGNVRDLPPKHFWLAATNWYKQYGAVLLSDFLHFFSLYRVERLLQETYAICMCSGKV